MEEEYKFDLDCLLELDNEEIISLFHSNECLTKSDKALMNAYMLWYLTIVYGAKYEIAMLVGDILLEALQKRDNVK